MHRKNRESRQKIRLRFLLTGYSNYTRQVHKCSDRIRRTAA